MPLTPEDVRNKRFTPVRLREGYDMGEVDQFLDEVETELERLTVENEELRAKVATASSGEQTGYIGTSASMPATGQTLPPAPSSGGASSGGASEGGASLGESGHGAEYQLRPAWEPGESTDPYAQQETPPSSPAQESTASWQFEDSGSHATEDGLATAKDNLAEAKASSRAGSVGEASAAAARLLEIASTNADELMDQAKDEADRVVGEAQTKAERIVSEARGKADRIETDSRIRAQKLDEETNERREQALGAIERERGELQQDVEHLRAYEREYRARLKNYFQTQLEGLAAQDQSYDDPQTPQSSAPRRIRADGDL